MPLVFANPAGFWALLGIPAILLIHFLQRQSVSLPASTLFLLDAVDRRSYEGRRFDRLRNSLPLWLQLLAVLILTWLLVEPRWTATRSVQRVVLVADSSASMAAFRDEALKRAGEALPDLTSGGVRATYTVLESHPRGENLYRGGSIADLVDALRDWNPADSAHSPEAALRVGRSLAGTDGTLVFLTDHEGDSLPFDAARLAVGEPIDNVGLAGLRVDTDGERPTWEVTVRNYADSKQDRSWFLASGERRTAPRRIELATGATRPLTGRFPEGAARATLALEPDEFPRDDRHHLVVPKPKRLLVVRSVAEGSEEFVADIVESLENTEPPGEGESPDLAFTTYDPLDPDPIPPTAVVFVHQQSVPESYFAGPIAAANHPLMNHLEWQGLIARRTPAVPPAEIDTPLLWQGDRTLVFLRQDGERRQLVFNFDVARSNAARLPAFIVLVDRFAARIREGEVALRRDNVELGQPLRIAFDTGEGAPPLTRVSEQGERTYPLGRASLLRAPPEPGFFQVRQGERLLFDGAVHFADTREADFSEAASVSELEGLAGEIAERRSRPDPWWQLWLAALILLALAIWYALSRPQAAANAERSTLKVES